ncbi:MAG: Dolichyl-phosphate-mannose-protein mannosyltransferase [Microgenomates group bacterium GW2011_GWC1_37_8]|uniref:Dolichyl-phosphate-mannose-protein mannosyltransferase n=1 Tax=Candidatus Woesebacteria bacterium GW2011_GWB1_38_8 TaxID=1618570 RepID=A0A0G0PA29_9BACT|nr:MAG: Dolichyl-phosphate-mannose-protein mannosyltransferase [Microgenomates group bacterium GW2011_GWC1_37_8]KKQ86141.1 MAG: Dolichyl-phosphate-mannose-protein mannosyltransferase [Candidatus Woesebacteria bacterium GW2011_GWB1_38_8]
MRRLKNVDSKIWLTLLLLIHLILLINIKFTAWPEMLAWPYLMLKGWLPYKDIAIAHTPFLFTVLSGFFKLTGIGLVQLEIFSWILILITDYLVFWVSNKLWGKSVALLSTIIFIFLHIFYEGNGLWFDLALTPFMIVLFYFFKKQKYLWLGVFWALAFLVKQTAFWFLVPITIYTLQGETLKGAKSVIAKIFYSSLIVFIPFTLFLISFRLFDDFYIWAIKFGMRVLPSASGQISLPTLIQLVKAYLTFIPLIFIPELLIWSLAGSLFAFPRWELFHFQPALPYIAFGFAIILSKPKNNIRKLISIIVLIIFLYPLARTIIRDWGKPARFYDSEILEVSAFVKQKIQPDEKILVLNSWDHLYALTETLPSYRPWMPQLSWYLKQNNLEDEMYKDIEKENPRIIILSPYKESGLGSYKPFFADQLISKYTKVYKTDNYEVLEIK